MAELFLNNTTAETCSPVLDGDKFDISTTQGTPTTVAESTSATEFEEILQWNLTVGTAGVKGAYKISLNIASVDANCEFRFRLQRTNSACVIQQSSEYSVIFNTSGIKQELILFEPDWAASDVLRFSLEARRVGSSGAKTVTVNVNDPDSTVDEPIDDLIIVRELFASRQGDSDSQTFNYLITGSDEPGAMRTQLLNDTEKTVDTVTREDDKITLTRLDTRKWLATVAYRKAPPPQQLEIGEQVFTFDTGGGTQHIMNSLSTTKYPAGAPDFKGAILVNENGPQGIDIVIPTYRFTEIKVLTAAQVSGSYKATVFGLTGQTNNGSFKGFAANEVLFLGAQGRQRGDDGWEITYNFAASPNLTGLTYGDVPNVAKKGWEFLWVHYKKTDNGNRLVRQPDSVHVEKVYDEGDFSTLLIGT